MEMKMVENKNENPMSMMGSQFFGNVDEKTQEPKEETKEQKFLNEIQDMANKAEDALAHSTFLLGQASLDPDKWSERNTKTLECNVLKAKVELIDNISELFMSMFNIA